MGLKAKTSRLTPYGQAGLARNVAENKFTDKLSHLPGTDGVFL